MRRSLILGTTLCLMFTLLGCTRGIRPDDIVGRWEQPKGPGKVVIEFEPDGTGEALLVTGEEQPGGEQPTPLSWSLDGNRLTYTLSGGEVNTQEVSIRPSGGGRLRVEDAAKSAMVSTGELTRSAK